MRQALFDVLYMLYFMNPRKPGRKVLDITWFQLGI